jgi:hypothetical protein
LPGLVVWVVRALLGDRSGKRKADPYLAFVIGPGGLAVAVHTVVARGDDDALERATLLRDGLPIELWCGSRKVGVIPSKPEQDS